MQFGPCIHCGRIILLANGARACGTCHILSTAEREQEENEQMTNDEHYQQRNSDNHNDRYDLESNVVHSDRRDNRTAAATTTTTTTTTIAAAAAAVIDNMTDIPNVMDLQTTIGREDLPQMLQRFLSYFDPNDSQQKGASDSEIAALDRRILGVDDIECGTECAICTELFERMELAKLPCNHEYHSECILHWLQLNSSCPMCRQSISNHEQQQQQQQQQPIAPTQNEPDLIIMRREMADRMYLENAPLHYMDDVD
ncbi:uncharacterized protein ATC70_010170 [Mucor velutinosus]|uniref:RING-type domain-containing protein n=1 Tax=Mucor velutinosus TaxID=708070 RepID=A0AAN7DRG3_9FUNG|nr:hypothetical protein ATC70_010170 [Mucor velutinosus]